MSSAKSSKRSMNISVPLVYYVSYDVVKEYIGSGKTLPVDLTTDTSVFDDDVVLRVDFSTNPPTITKGTMNVSFHQS